MARTKEEREAAKLEREAKAARIKAEFASSRAMEPETTEKQYAANREKRAANIKKDQERREQRLKEKAIDMQFDAPSLQEIQRANRKTKKRTEKRTQMAASGKASGGMTKKYGYMGGGKVYGQPRKANYKAG